jgi:hypothetical protein
VSLSEQALVDEVDPSALARLAATAGDDELVNEVLRVFGDLGDHGHPTGEMVDPSGHETSFVRRRSRYPTALTESNAADSIPSRYSGRNVSINKPIAMGHGSLAGSTEGRPGGAATRPG